MTKLLLRVPGVADPVAVEVQRGDAPTTYLCKAGASQAEIEYGPLADGGGWMRIHGRVIPFYMAYSDSKVEVWLEGRTYSLEIVDTTRRREAVGRGPVSDEIVAPMPGTILKILAAKGDSFDAHQPLIVMESMKMEMTLSAPHAGRIREIRCSVGELVSMGKTLAKLEAMPGDDASK